MAARGRAARKQASAGEGKGTMPWFLNSYHMRTAAPRAQTAAKAPVHLQARRAGGEALRPKNKQLAAASPATTNLTTASSSAVERWAPGCDAIQMTKANRRRAARTQVAPKRRDDPPPAGPAGADPGTPPSKASGAGASARAAAPAVTVSAVSTAMILIAPALSVGPSVIDVLGMVGSARDEGSRMSRGAIQDYRSWRGTLNEFLQPGCRAPVALEMPEIPVMVRLIPPAERSVLAVLVGAALALELRSLSFLRQSACDRGPGWRCRSAVGRHGERSPHPIAEAFEGDVAVACLGALLDGDDALRPAPALRPAASAGNRSALRTSRCSRSTSPLCSKCWRAGRPVHRCR